MIYSDIRVIDGDTIEVKTWPRGLSEICRIEGIDCDEMGTKRGKEQRDIAFRIICGSLCRPYISSSFERSRFGLRKKRDKYGRLLVKVYVWRWCRYVEYSKWMKKKGYVKRGSKWNQQK